jgi:hypothetical protein
VIVAETPGVVESLAQLDCRTRELVEYVEANGGSTMNYGAQHRRGKPHCRSEAAEFLEQLGLASQQLQPKVFTAPAHG